MSGEEIYLLIGQGVGVIAFITSCLRYFLRKKQDILKLSIVVYLIYIAHYFMIDAIAGSSALVISIFRDLYLYQREKHHKKHRHRRLYNNAFVFIIFFAIYASMLLINITEPKNMLPYVAGMVYFCFEWFTTNKTTLKIASSFTNIPWVIYDIISMSFAGLTADIVSFIVAFFGILKDKNRRKHGHHSIMKKRL
ncbi:YgjV family protein [Candidatus Saccharibacteria bacterium]|nr:YgjV family protein [Candidatus Saccharibacteria bacterium]